jgi:hypothetical protein
MTQFTVSDYEVITHEADTSQVIKRSDGASIPMDERNRDYQEFLTVTAGEKVKTTVIPISEPEPTEIDLLKARITTLESDMDTVKTGVTDLQDARTVEK